MKAGEQKIVRRVLRELEDNVWSGVFRPGSWERGWLVQAIGEERFAELVGPLEPTPGAEWRLRPLLVMVLLALAAACGGDDRDTCEEVGAALCARSSECELLDPSRVEWCVGEYRRGCADRPPDDDQADACVEALADFDCDELAAGASPAECDP